MCRVRRKARSTGIFSGLSWLAANFEHIGPSGFLLEWYSRQKHIQASWRSWWRWHRRGWPLWSMQRTCRGVSSRCCCWIRLKARESNAQYVLKIFDVVGFCVLMVLRLHPGFNLRADFGVCGCAPELPSWAGRIRAAGGPLRAHAPPKQQLVRYLLVSGISCFGAAEISVGSWMPLHKGQYRKFSDRLIFCFGFFCAAREAAVLWLRLKLLQVHTAEYS